MWQLFSFLIPLITFFCGVSQKSEMNMSKLSVFLENKCMWKSIFNHLVKNLEICLQSVDLELYLCSVFYISWKYVVCLLMWFIAISMWDIIRLTAVLYNRNAWDLQQSRCDTTYRYLWGTFVMSHRWGSQVKCSSLPCWPVSGTEQVLSHVTSRWNWSPVFTSGTEV